MGWSGWFNIGAPAGGFVGGPATISRNKDVCNVYVRGNDNKLWQRAYSDGQWHAWIRHGDGVLASEPALGSMGPDHEHVFVRGTDGNVYQKYWQYTLEPAAEVSFAVSECVYGWTARYQQSGTHVTVRIQLNPDAGISAATMNTLRTVWRDGIMATWGNRFDCRAPNGGRQTLTFDVQWVTSNAHHVVRVRPGPMRSNMSNWDTADTGNVSAHEFGHMLGHPDEYADSACPSRNPVGTGTVMEDNTETVARLYNRIASFHGSGHTPTATGAPEPDATLEDVRSTMLIDNLKPKRRAAVLKRLNSAAEPDAVLDDAAGVQVSFEVVGGAPGERYAYALRIQADGTAQRAVSDDMSGAAGSSNSPAVDASGTVDPDLVAGVFAAARDAGLLAAEPPKVPQQNVEIVPDSLIAIITVRDGDAVRRVVVPASEPGTSSDSSGPIGSDDAEITLDTPMRLPSESVDALRPVLDALRVVEAVL